MMASVEVSGLWPLSLIPSLRCSVFGPVTRGTLVFIYPLLCLLASDGDFQ